jgi:hypothetical protein
MGKIRRLDRSRDGLAKVVPKLPALILHSKRMIRWFARLPLTEVAAHSLIAGVVSSALETAGRISWGHEALLVANVPIVAWAAAQWWTNRKSRDQWSGS